MKIDISKLTKLDHDLYDEMIDAELIITPVSDDFPMPWDADIDILDGRLMLTGHAGPSGYGSAQTEIPLKDATKYVSIEIDDEITPELTAAMVDAGIVFLGESKKVVKTTKLTEADAQFNDKYFPRVDITDKARYKFYKYKGHNFVYDVNDALLIEVFQDEDEVAELGDEAPWRELDAVGLRNSNWMDKEARDDYIDEYLMDQMDALSMATNDLAFEFGESKKIVEDNEPITIHGYAATWKITPTEDGKYNVMPGNKNYDSVKAAKAAIRAGEKRYADAHPDAEVKNRDIWFDHGIMITDDDSEGYFD